MLSGRLIIAALTASWSCAFEAPPDQLWRATGPDGGARDSDRSGDEATTDPDWPADEPIPPEFDLPPFVTLPAADRVSVGWATLVPSMGTVEWVAVADPHAPADWRHALAVTVDVPALLHHVTLGPLPSAAAFRYRVIVAGSGAAREGVFVSPGAKRFRVVHLAEFHAPSQADRAALFSPVIREFAPHVVVESGDMVDDGNNLDHWRSYLRTSAPWISNVILLPAHSNHVNGAIGNPLLLDLFELPGNERWYLTRYGPTQFMTLDSTARASLDVSLEPDWIRERLTQARAAEPRPEFFVAAWHHPACSSTYATRTTERRWVLQNLLMPLEEAGGVDLVLVGHDKYFERSDLTVSGHHLVHLMNAVGRVAPGEEGENEPECSPVVTATGRQTIGLLQIEPRRLSAEVVDPTGALVDAFELRR